MVPLRTLLVVEERFLQRIEEVRTDPAYPLAFREGRCVTEAAETRERIEQLKVQIASASAGVSAE
jgi:hypothetical protein